MKNLCLVRLPDVRSGLEGVTLVRSEDLEKFRENYNLNSLDISHIDSIENLLQTEKIFYKIRLFDDEVDDIEVLPPIFLLIDQSGLPHINHVALKNSFHRNDNLSCIEAFVWAENPVAAVQIAKEQLSKMQTKKEYSF